MSTHKSSLVQNLAPGSYILVLHNYGSRTLSVPWLRRRVVLINLGGGHCLTPVKVFGYVNLPDQDTLGMTFHVLDRVVVGLPYFPSFLLYL